MKYKKTNILRVLLRSLKDIIKINPRESLILLVSSISASISVGLATFVLSKLINSLEYIKIEQSLNNIIYYMVVLIGLFVFEKFVDGFFTNNRIKIESTIQYVKDLELSKKCYNMPIINYENHEYKNKLNRAKKCLKNMNMTDLSLSIVNIISGLFRFIIILIVLASFNIYLVPVSIISVLPFFIIRLIRGKKFYELRWFQSKKERKRDYLRNLFKDKRSIKEIRVFGTQRYLENKFIEINNEINEEIWEFKKKDTLSFFLCDAIKIIGYIGSIFLIILMVIKGWIDIGAMSASIIALSTFQTETKYLFVNIARIPESVVFTKDYYDFIDQKEETYGEKKFSLENHDIYVQNVSFKYPNTEKRAINNLSLSIKKGETVVILGENGSGKTTLAMLLLGLYKCDNGIITYGKQNINNIELNTLFEHVSIVPQNFNKYNLTLRENIGIGDLEKMNDNKNLINILMKLKLDSLANSDELDKVMGIEFGGRELSIGQWQKIAISRSLLKDCDIVILDEPTVALDPLIESEILKDFISISKNKTAIIISHRVGLCKVADKIIVMKDGKVVECGTHQDLINNDNEYHRLYTAQSKWYVG